MLAIWTQIQDAFYVLLKIWPAIIDIVKLEALGYGWVSTYPSTFVESTSLYVPSLIMFLSCQMANILLNTEYVLFVISRHLSLRWNKFTLFENFSALESFVWEFANQLERVRPMGIVGTLTVLTIQQVWCLVWK